MRVRLLVVPFLVSALFVALPLHAQDATVAGTVTDESGAVLPGVTATATSLDTGREYVAVTTDRGEYRLLGVPAGRYRIQAELQGFATVIVESIELLVGQNATVPLSMKVAALAETVLVTSESPLIDLRSSQVAGNVDRRQMEALPINGRNWMELSLLVKGITANTVGSRPGVSNDRDFQLNLDGQQITNQRCCSGTFGNAQLSREAIAEYQVVTNLFDVSMGRSTGIQVQAITKSGTNNFDGSVYGYFRDDRLNSADPFTNQVLPYSNQQTGGSLGGPIIQNRAHFFGSYEYEREPNSVVVSPSAYTTGQLITLPSKSTINNVLGRVDYQLTSANRFSARALYFKRFNPFDSLATNAHPTRGTARTRESIGLSGTWTRVMGGNKMQEVGLSYFRYHYNNGIPDGVVETPEYIFPGLTIGPAWNYPNPAFAPISTASYHLTWNRGAHDLKIGTEYRWGTNTQWWPARSRGRMFFSARPADIDRRFPLSAWNDPTRWDLTGLDALALRYDIAYSNDYNNWQPTPSYAVWIGDTWQLNTRLTLNVGVRYDIAWRELSPPGVRETDLIINNGLFSENVGFRNDIVDGNNVAPRVGFTWNVTGNGSLAIRGGTGLFYSGVNGVPAGEQQKRNGQREIEASFVNDNRAGFVLDPTRGVTAADVLSGRVQVGAQNLAPIAHDYQGPTAWQTIIGIQRQIGEGLGLDADLVYMRGRNEDTQRDANLFYDPVTGFPRHPNRFGRPAAAYGEIFLRGSQGRSEYLALPMSVTRRYRNNFQASVTYTLMFFKNDNASGDGGWGGGTQNPFNRELDWGRRNDFQRHTFRANGIWSLPWQITASGLARYGSGGYASILSGVNPLATGSTRIRNDLSLIPRNTFHEDSYFDVDLRVTKELRLPGTLRLTGIAEVFNVFNHERFSYNLIENAATFRQRQGSAGPPRSGQLAFKLSF
jgi:hypothetical protein